MKRKLTDIYWGLAAIALLGGISSNALAQTITHVPLYTFHGDSSGDQFGGSVSGAGDVNGDGKADLIVGADFDKNKGTQSGSARVFSGSDGSVLYNFDGDGPNNHFGASVSGAGDVNGDGKADLIVGAPVRFSNGTARVLSGSDGSVLYNLIGTTSRDSFGGSVSGAGDVNGDGTPDLIVGAPRGSGSARVLSGSDGSVLYNLVGTTNGDAFGSSVSGAGDVNGDGTPDLIVGVPNFDGGGRARVLSGSDGSVLYNFDGDNVNDSFGLSVSGAGDVNGDGKADLIVGAEGANNLSGSARVISGFDGSVIYNFAGDSTEDLFGSSVSGAGDVNGDGRADLIVGAPFDDNNGLGSGSVRVLSGSDGSVLYNFDGDSAGDSFGRSVSDAGDVNGDGIDDFIVGADRGGASDGGYARVFVSQVLGDCNQDGLVNPLDVSPFIAILSDGDFLGQADTNKDGAVNSLDIRPFIALLSY